MSNKNKGEKVESFVAEPVVNEEAPIEEAPVVAEEVMEEKKEIPEIRQEENKSARQVKNQPKQFAKVILITRDGCIAEKIGEPGNNVSFYGAEFLAKNLGDVIEF